MKVEEKLALLSTKADAESHIRLDGARCARCKARPCLFACPAGLWTQDESGRVKVEHSGCLECGTCLVVCPLGAVTWNYPRPPCGVHYRLG